MDENTNLNTLKEMVLDEQKLVTYISLSKELCIHVNDTKKILRKFIENIREKQPNTDLNVSYIISGISKDNNARITVCSDKELATTKDTFNTIFFEHVYSVSKGLSSLDNVAFMAVNKFEDFPLCQGIIKSSTCIKRTSDEIGKLKTNSQEIVLVEQKPSALPNKNIKDEKQENTALINGNETSTNNNVAKDSETKSESIIKAAITAPNKNPTGNTKHKAGGKTQKGIAGFFIKSNSELSQRGKKENYNKSETVMSITKEENQENSDIKKEELEVDEDVDKVDISEPINEKKQYKEISSSNKSLNHIKRKAKVDKKRKRVLHISDSESDAENDPFASESKTNNHDLEDEIPPTPTNNTFNIKSGINPKKKRRIVDKTYTDEDGYILTKKEEIYESCSDNEEEVTKGNNKHVNNVGSEEKKSPQKKIGSKNNKKKVSPQHGKQTNIMSFFKKV